MAKKNGGLILRCLIPGQYSYREGADSLGVTQQ